MSNPAFSHIYLMGRQGVAGVPEALQETYDFLQQHPYHLTVESATANLMTNAQSVAPTGALPDDVDIILVVGGDGSLLNAARIASQYSLPVLGINRGRLGFLTDIPPSEIHSLHQILQGDYQAEQRPFLEAQFTTQDQRQHQLLALNDVVLLPGDIAHMIEYDTYVDDLLVYNQRADGLIIATPTGSTAYCLSGGGPVLHPSLDAMVMVPMFPHTLSSRPIVLNGNSEVRVHIKITTETSPYLSCDGHSKHALAIDSDIIVKKSSLSLRLIHPRDYDYYTILREKLGWEHHARRT